MSEPSLAEDDPTERGVSMRDVTEHGLAAYRLFFRDKLGKIRGSEDVDAPNEQAIRALAAERLAAADHAVAEIWRGETKVAALERQPLARGRLWGLRGLIDWFRA